VARLRLPVQLAQQHQLGAAEPVGAPLRLQAEGAARREGEALQPVGAGVRVVRQGQRQAGAGRRALRHLQGHGGLREARRVVVEVPHLQLHVHQAERRSSRARRAAQAQHVEGQQAGRLRLAAQLLPVQPLRPQAQLPVPLPDSNQRPVTRRLHQPESSLRSRRSFQGQLVGQGSDHRAWRLFLVGVVPNRFAQSRG
uniref:Uncharacterized protein n=1 Tax=Pseudonaja textilis TaxID=8673 RepID=A0A670Y827_PSETE